MTQHLGSRPDKARPEGQDNDRNTTISRTVITDNGLVRIEVPRDRNGSFEPQIIRTGP